MACGHCGGIFIAVYSVLEDPINAYAYSARPPSVSFSHNEKLTRRKLTLDNFNIRPLNHL